jgi:hypothetical protein
LELFIDVISKTFLKIKPIEEADSEYLNNVMGCIISGSKGVFHKVMLYNAMKFGEQLPMKVQAKLVESDKASKETKTMEF